MKAITQTYLLSDNVTKLTLDNDSKLATFHQDIGSGYNLSFDCLADLADICRTLSEKRRSPEVSIRSSDGSESPGRLVPRMPMKRPMEEALHDPAPTGIEGRDLATSNLWVIRLDGLFYKRPTQLGQGERPFTYISEATLFESPEAALPITQSFPGAEIKLFSDVGEYRIAIVLPDGQIRFHKGNGFEPSAHVNDSMVIVSRGAAMSQLSTVQVPAGCRAFLLPNLA